MNRFLILISFLFLCGPAAHSQYLPFAENDKLWYYFAQGPLGVNDAGYKITGDTLINSRRYPLIARLTSTMKVSKMIAYVDEDTTSGKVKIHHFNPPRPVVEYDFSLAVGDTIHDSTWASQPQSFVVDSIGTFIDLQGKYRKQLWFNQIDRQDPGLCGFSWIEGIGTLLWSPAEPFQDCYIHIDPTRVLSCAFIGQARIFGALNSNCFSMNIREIDPQDISLFPNPVTRFLYFSRPVDRGQIFDLHGALVLTQKENVQKLDLYDLPEGIYFSHTMNLDGVIRINNIVKAIP